MFPPDPVLSMQKQQSSHSINEAPFRALARMVVQRPKTPHDRKRKDLFTLYQLDVHTFTVFTVLSFFFSSGGFLKWDIKNSRYSHPEINYYDNSWISILVSGDYHVYSKVTFSSGNSTTPLTNRVMLRKTKTDKESVLMQAFCHLDRVTKLSSLCTATTVDVVKLEKGNQLSVWTEDLSLVDYDGSATTFGLYSLW